MTTVAIVPETTRRGAIRYRAISRLAQSTGASAGAALDALTRQLPDGDAGTLVVVQHMRPDDHFPEVSRRRLAELMTLSHAAADSGHALSPDASAELGVLVDEELDAVIARSAALVGAHSQ